MLFWRALGWIGVRRVVLYVRGFDPANSRTHREVDFGRMEPAELGQYLAFRPDSHVPELRRRVAAGDVCYVARRNGEIVSARWTSTSELRINHLGYGAPLGNGQAYLYDAYTAPPCRGRGISRRLTSVIVARLHDQGIREMLSAADPANPAGSGLNRGDGTPVATLVSIGFRRRLQLRLPPPLHPRIHGFVRWGKHR